MAAFGKRTLSQIYLFGLNKAENEITLFKLGSHPDLF